MRLKYLLEAQEVFAAPPIAARAETESVQARAKRYFGALDTLDADAAAAFFASGATVRLSGLTPISGRTAIRRALVRFLVNVDELRHVPVKLWTSGNLSVFEADMTLMLADRTTLVFPVTHVLRWASGLIAEAHVNVYLESRMAIALSAFDRCNCG